MNQDFQRIQKISALCRQYNELFLQVKEIKTIIHELLHHETENKFTIDVHNIAQHEKNEAERNARRFTYPEEMEKVAFYPGMIMAMPGGFVTSTPPPCRRKVIFKCSEATGIKIMAALLREKEEEQREIYTKLMQEQIIVTTDSSNPIIDLYNGNI